MGGGVTIVPYLVLWVSFMVVAVDIAVSLRRIAGR